MRKALVACTAISLVLSASAWGTPAAADDLIVHTSNGDLQGIAVGTEHEWRGVPFAAPPVGDLRWRPPAPAEPWTGVRDATKFAPACVQVRFGPTGIEGTTGREDCLYLNVFTPASATSGSSLPVMVHVHPGNNYFLQPYQDAAAFTDRGVIVVTVAHRLGILGWGGHKGLTAEQGTPSGEYGMLDLLAALHWVQDEIVAFGGDPGNVTLFGSSAGSFDALGLMASPLAAGLFERVAIQGAPFGLVTGIDNDVHTAESLGRHAARLTGCNRADDVVGCLRDQPARRLVRIEGLGDLSPWIGGIVTPEPPIEALAGETSLPLLAGFDREEDRYNALPVFPIPDPFPRRDWIDETDHLVGPDHGDEARALYPPSAYDSRAWAFVTMATDAVRGCPTRRLANVIAAPTYRWLYTHVYENDPGNADGRAAHIYEEPFLWGDFSLFGFDHTPTPAEETLSARMTDYWTNFAKTGDPNGPGLPPWPRYDTTTEPTLALDDEITVVERYHAEQCALLDTLRPFPR